MLIRGPDPAVEPFRALYGLSGMRRTVAMVIVLALVLTGCSWGGSSRAASSSGGAGSSSSEATTGSVVGSVWIVGGPLPGGPRREKGHLNIHLVSRSQPVLTVTTDSQGRFAFDLPPGRYRVTMGPNTPTTPRGITVRSNATTHLKLTIQAM